MTVCNMSIEGGARVGYVNPDQTTFDYISGRPFAPQGEDFDRACAWWSSMASDADARYDDEVTIRRGVDSADRHVGDQPGTVGRDRRADSRRRGRRGARVHGLPARAAAEGHADRRRVRRLVHERPALGSPGGRTRAARASGRPAREGAGRAGIAGGAGGSRARRARPRVHRGWLRMAWRGLLDVPGDEPGPPRGSPRSAHHPPTGTSRDGRGAPPDGRS